MRRRPRYDDLDGPPGYAARENARLDREEAAEWKREKRAALVTLLWVLVVGALKLTFVVGLGVAAFGFFLGWWR